MSVLKIRDENGKFQPILSIKGEDGANATITGATASVDDKVGTPSVKVTVGGTESERTFDFAFSGLKGADGTGSGGGDTEIFIAEYGVTTMAELDTAFNEGKFIFCKYIIEQYVGTTTSYIPLCQKKDFTDMSSGEKTISYIFATVSSSVPPIPELTCSNGVWSMNYVTYITSKVSNDGLYLYYTPSYDSQAVNKKYVDDAIAAALGG